MFVGANNKRKRLSQSDKIETKAETIVVKQTAMDVLKALAFIVCKDCLNIMSFPGKQEKCSKCGVFPDDRIVTRSQAIKEFGLMRVNELITPVSKSPVSFRLKDILKVKQTKTKRNETKQNKTKKQTSKNTHTNTQIHTNTHKHTQTQIHIHKYTQRHKHTNTNTHKDTNTQTQIHIHKYTHTQIHTNIKKK